MKITHTYKQRPGVAPRSIQCPVCETPSGVEGARDGAVLIRCRVCGLQFFHGGRMPHDAYERAYRGEVTDAGMSDYYFRSRYLAPLGRAGQPLFPPLRLSLRWLSKHAPPGSVVVDVGCARGDMLRELRARGYQAAGTDISPAAGALAESLGFPVHIGPVDTYPEALPQPDYITCNMVLHHPEDPVAFLRTIAGRFPRAPLLVTEALYPNWMHGLVPTPRPEFPRQLTSWTLKALAIALTRGGYARHAIIPTRPSPDDIQLPVLVWLGRATAQRREQRTPEGGRPVRGLATVMRIAIVGKRVIFGPAAFYARVRRLLPASALAVAHPDGTEGAR